MQHIYMLRHGQSKNNAEKIVTGSRETPLSELGIGQAHAAGEEARGLVIDLIVASPLKRAQQTARIVAEEIGYAPEDILTIPGFAERNLGKLEGASYAHNEHLNGNFPAVEHIAGVEPLTHFHQRIQQGFRQLVQDKKHHSILIVCHLGVGRMLRTIVAGQEPFAIYEQPRLENARIYPLF